MRYLLFFILLSETINELKELQEVQESCCEFTLNEFTGVEIPASPGITPGSVLHRFGKFRLRIANILRDPR